MTLRLSIGQCFKGNFTLGFETGRPCVGFRLRLGFDVSLELGCWILVLSVVALELLTKAHDGCRA